MQQKGLERRSGKSARSAPLTCSVRITERIEYKLLTSTQPPYLHKLISTQRHRSTRSSSVVTLARPASSSSLKITDRSFRYMLHLVSGISSLCLFVNLILAPVPPSPAHLFLHPSLLPLLIHHFVHLSFTPGLKPTSLTNPTPLGLYSFTSSSRTASTDFCLHRFFLSYSVFDFDFFSLFFVSGPCATLSWPSSQLLSARRSTVSYIVSYRIVSCDALLARHIWYSLSVRRLSVDQTVTLKPALYYKNSSGDEIANVNFLRRYRTYFKILTKRTYFV